MQSGKLILVRKPQKQKTDAREKHYEKNDNYDYLLVILLLLRQLVW